MKRWMTCLRKFRAVGVGVTGLTLFLGSFSLAAVPSAAASKAPETAQKGEDLPRLREKTRGLDKSEGFLTFFLDKKQGKIYLQIEPADDAGQISELIYLEGLTAGLGSNPVGLDRGQIGDSHFLRLRRLGPRVFLEAPNLTYRALSDDGAEQRATRESFATSILWAQDIVAEDPDGTALVDFTSFLLRDAHGVAKTLRETSQGGFSLDTSRSMIDFDDCLAFPDNIELQAILTFAGGDPGEQVQATAPIPTQVTLVQHISLLRPPAPGFKARAFDPRISAYDLTYIDYAAGLDESIHKRWLVRHRLEKTDPTAERSAAVEPIVYYVDGGAPEPVRSALLDGARWWAEAFEAAGFIDAYRVEVLPEDVHPLDARYNVIQWVHRSTRGWSYGTSLIDPRSGEIIKGHVNLGSLRVRQDRLLFEGLAGVGKTGTGVADDPIQLALARLRQLAAHEVGHTLGFAHNFAASTYDGRASVMDYPAPWVRLDGDRLDFSQAYAVGMGSWDIHAARFAYTEFASDVDESEALEALVQEGIRQGQVFLTDEDARPPGASEPRANLWDNGSDAVEALQETLAVRAHALKNFGLDRLPVGEPVAKFEEVLAPVYFHHRYQLDAAVKTVGGLEYNYALVGDGQWTTRQVSGERQQRALEVITSILEPQVLDFPEPVLQLLSPRPFQLPRHRELFASGTAPTFDALGAARTAADQVVQGLLQPERLARVLDFHRRGGDGPSVVEVFDALADQAFGGAADEMPRYRVLRSIVRRVLVERMMVLASAASSPQVRATAEAYLDGLRGRLDLTRPDDKVLDREIQRFGERVSTGTMPRGIIAAEPPPGSPIGSTPARFGCGTDPAPAPWTGLR